MLARRSYLLKGYDDATTTERPWHAQTAHRRISAQSCPRFLVSGCIEEDSGVLDNFRGEVWRLRTIMVVLGIDAQVKHNRKGIRRMPALIDMTCLRARRCGSYKNLAATLTSHTSSHHRPLHPFVTCCHSGVRLHSQPVPLSP